MPVFQILEITSVLGCTGIQIGCVMYKYVFDLFQRFSGAGILTDSQKILGPVRMLIVLALRNALDGSPYVILACPLRLHREHCLAAGLCLYFGILFPLSQLKYGKSSSCQQNTH